MKFFEYADYTSVADKIKDQRLKIKEIGG